MSVHATCRRPGGLPPAGARQRFLRSASWSACRCDMRSRGDRGRHRSRRCARTPARDRREGQRLSRLHRGRRGAPRRPRDGGHRGLRPGRRRRRTQAGASPNISPKCSASGSRRSGAEPPRGHRAAPGEGGGELRVAHGRQVGRAARRLRRDPAGRRGRLRRRGPDHQRLPGGCRRRPVHTARGEGAAGGHPQLDHRDREARGHPGARGARAPRASCSQAAEVFLTGTTAGVWPVGLDRRADVGDGEPGPGEQPAARALRAASSRATTPTSRTGSRR